MTTQDKNYPDLGKRIYSVPESSSIKIKKLCFNFACSPETRCECVVMNPAQAVTAKLAGKHTFLLLMLPHLALVLAFVRAVKANHAAYMFFAYSLIDATTAMRSSNDMRIQWLSPEYHGIGNRRT